MVGNSVYILAIVLSPAVSAAVCSVITLFGGGGLPAESRQVRRVLLLYYVAMFVTWVAAGLYAGFPVAFACTGWVAYLSVLLIPVLFYHLIYLLTRRAGTRPFSPWHYALPVLIPAVLLVWSLFVPFDVQVEVVMARSAPVAGYELFTTFATTKLEVRLALNVVYTVLGFYRLMRYRREVVNYSADDYRSALGWIRVLLILSVPLNFAPLVIVVADRSFLLESLTMLLPVAILMFQHPLLCYNVLMRNYVIIRDPQPEEIQAVERPSAAAGGLTREVFDAFIATHKPYLQSDLKITDLTDPLRTNRTYLSAFINREYGMNFSMYINSLRLRELQELTDNPDFAGWSLGELTGKAGFGSYHSYSRLKKRGEQPEKGIDKPVP